MLLCNHTWNDKGANANKSYAISTYTNKNMYMTEQKYTQAIAASENIYTERVDFPDGILWWRGQKSGTNGW